MSSYGSAEDGDETSQSEGSVTEVGEGGESMGFPAEVFAENGNHSQQNGIMLSMLQDMIFANDLTNRTLNGPANGISEDEASIHVPAKFRPVVQVGNQFTPSLDRPHVSQRSPNLQQCREALGSDESLHALLEEMLEPDGHVNHLKDWIMFLVCASLASDEVLRLDPSDQLHWCKSNFPDAVAANHQRVCPKSFVVGDVVWNCESCQRDTTCVQCQECFEQSNHDGHQYYFTLVTSAGSGCCDCGDSQAWKPSGFCSRHGKDSVIPELSPEVASAAARVLHFLAAWLADACSHISVQYQKYPEMMQKHGMVHFETISFFPASGQEMRQENPVSNLVAVEKDCEEEWEVGTPMAHLKLVFSWSTERLCSRVSVLAQALYDLCKDSDALVRTLCDSITTDHNLPFRDRARRARELKALALGGDVQYEFLDALIVADTFLPASPSHQLTILYMRLLTDAAFKERFAVSYAKTYITAYNLACQSPMFRSTSDQKKDYNGVFGLSVQFMNRAVFVQTLVQEYDFLCDVLECWYIVIKEKGMAEAPYPRLNPKAKVFHHRVYAMAQSDLKYILFAPEMPQYLLFERLDLLNDYWLSTLKEMQGVDAVVRIASTQPALEFENDDFTYALYLACNATALSLNMTRCLLPETETDLDYMKRSPPQFLRSCERLVDLLATHVASGESKMREWCGLNGRTFHIPLFRFIATVVSLCCSAVFSVTGDKSAALSLVERLGVSQLRSLGSAASSVLGFNAQVTSRMWIRNGRQVEETSFFYEAKNPGMFRDIDLRLCQIAAVGGNAHSVLQILASPECFDLRSSYLFGSFIQRETDALMSEELLSTIVHIVRDMPQVWSSEATVASLQKQKIRRVIIQWLAAKPRAFSLLTDNAAAIYQYLKPVSEDVVSDIINQIAVQRFSVDGMNATLYELKDEAWEEFDLLSACQIDEASGVTYERWVEARAKLRKLRPDAPSRPVCPKFDPNTNPIFEDVRVDFLREAFPLAARGFVVAKQAAIDVKPGVMSNWGSCVALPSLHVLTLAVHAGLGKEDKLWSAHPELVEALDVVAKSSPMPPFDAIVKEGVEWLIIAARSESSWFREKMAELNPPPTTAASTSVASGDPNEDVNKGTVLPKKGTKRNRAQEKTLEKMRQMALQFGKQHAEELVDDGSDGPTKSKVRGNQEDVNLDELANIPSEAEDTEEIIQVADPECCVCRGASNGDAAEIHNAAELPPSLMLLGFLQISEVLIGPSPSRLLSWSNDRVVVTFCGHAMHTSCHQNWLNAQAAEAIRSPFQIAIENRQSGEFLCPLCKTVSNVLAPYQRKCQQPFWSREIGSSNDERISSNLLFEPILGGVKNAGQDNGPLDDRVIAFVKKFRTTSDDSNDECALFEIMASSFAEVLLCNPSDAANNKVKTALLALLSTAWNLGGTKLVTQEWLELDALGILESGRAPETALGFIFAVTLLRRCEGNLSHNILETLESQIGRAMLQLFALRLILALADPIQPGESDSFKAPWDVTDTTPTRIINPQSLPALEEGESSLLIAAANALWSDFGDHPSEFLSIVETLPAAVLLQLAPFLEECDAFLTLLDLPKELRPSISRVRDVMSDEGLIDFAHSIGKSKTLEAFVSRSLTYSLAAVPLHHPLRVRQLVTLPEDYATLLSLARPAAPCTVCRSSTGSHEMAVCLLCGALVQIGMPCGSNDILGGCTMHASRLHNKVSIFYLVSQCKTLLVSDIKMATTTSLYVDKHGEDRQNQSRALPMKLEQRRLAKMQHIFASHTIPHEVTTMRQIAERVWRDAVF